MKTYIAILKSLLLTLLIVTAGSCKKPAGDESIDIPFEKYVMPNGLQVILHTDHSDPMISFAIMYHTGSSREKPGKTGFAHLFEHLLFGGSENVEPGRFDMVIEGVGGMNNGGTSRDYTVYFEVFPKNALEKILWLESDRMGFFINSVTQRLMAIQQNVVQNEKRQYEDNSPYGFTEWTINRNLYPEGHPYSWTVIGEMEDLTKATLDDTRNFYNEFYGPNNATLVLSGDFQPDSVKLLIDKYFKEIEPHGEVEKRQPVPVKLEKSVRVYHEDNFANVPEINIVWPVPEAYHKDTYALDFLAELLSEGKKAPLYKVLVKEKQLTPRISARNTSDELAGEFTITARANEEINLQQIEDAVYEAFSRFETEGITDRDIERIKAASEMDFYQGINGILTKSFQLAAYNTLLGDPGYLSTDIENIKAVTREDVIRVYNQYIKDRPCVVTSFIPRGRKEMMAVNSVEAGVKEESISESSQVEIASESDGEIVKTPSVIDRTKEPPAGKDPEVKLPEIWKASLANGIEVAGIYNSELPLVEMKLIINGGISADRTDMPGVAALVAAILPQGTSTKTPEALEEEIQMLGSSINVSAGREDITISCSSLSRNFSKSVGLVKEILLEPRWDTSEFRIARNRTRNLIFQEEAQPSSIANLTFYKLLYGPDHIFGYNTRGTKESIEKITIESLKDFYGNYFSPKLSRIVIAGNITKDEALKILEPITSEWVSKDVALPLYAVPDKPDKSSVYFVDVPGSRQSVIYIGYPALARNNPDYIKTEFINYRLGGAFTSIFNQILREQKGYTYGAFSRFQQMKITAPFLASSMVRSDATYESVKIFRDEMEKYRNGITPEELEFTRNYMLRSNALRFETNTDLADMLSTMVRYGLPDNYIKEEEKVIRAMTLEDHKETTRKYIVPDKMYYVVVGDAATQIRPLEKVGLGKPVLLSK